MEVIFRFWSSESEQGSLLEIFQNLTLLYDLDGSLLVRAFLSILVIEVVGGRRRYWFQNCSVEHGGKVEEDSEEGEEDAEEEGVDDPLETEEARDLEI